MRDFTQAFFTIALVLALLFSNQSMAKTAEARTFNLVAPPIFSSNVIMRQWWEPIKAHIADETDIQVELDKAASYKHYFKRIDDSQTHLVMTPGHLASYLYRYHRLEPLLSLQRTLVNGLMHQKDDTLAFPAEIKEQCIATASPYSLSAHISRQLLKQHHISLEQLKYHRGFDNAIFSLIKKQCDYVMLPKLVFDSVNPRLKKFYAFKALHTLEQGGLEIGISQQFKQAHPKVGQQIEAALLRFGQTKKTQHILNNGIHGYFKPYQKRNNPLLQFNPFTDPVTNKLFIR